MVLVLLLAFSQGKQNFIAEDLREVDRLDVHRIAGTVAQSSFLFAFSPSGKQIAMRIQVADAGPTGSTRANSREIIALVHKSGKRLVATSKKLAPSKTFLQFLAMRGGSQEILLNDSYDLVGLDSETLRELHRTTPEHFGSPFALLLSTVGLSTNGRFLAAIYREASRTPDNIRLTRRTRAFETRLCVFDLENRSLHRQCSLEAGPDDVFQIAVSSAESIVVFAHRRESSEDTLVRVLDTNSCRPVREWRVNEGVSDLVLFPDERAVALAFTGGETMGRVMRLSDGVPLLEIHGKEKGSLRRRLAISPDSRWLAIDMSTLRSRFLSERTELRNLGASVWDLASGRHAGNACLPTNMRENGFGSLGSMAFSPDSRYLVISAPDGTLRFFAVPSLGSKSGGGP
jgi:WD40 repeat protein